MEVNGSQNNPTNINDVLDDVNAAAAQADVLATQTQTALGMVFFSLLQRMLSTAQENSSSGA